MTDDPILNPNLQTKLVIRFASRSVLVLREEEAFSFQSLVADCGGVLGLFIGFNFLMIWDWIMWIVDKFILNGRHNK